MYTRYIDAADSVKKTICLIFVIKILNIESQKLFFMVEDSVMHVRGNCSLPIENLTQIQHTSIRESEKLTVT